jgi:uncharacterized protein YegP (UPF0339 family)
MVYEDYLRCNEYEGQGAHASEAGFSAFYHEESQRHFFALLDDTGKVLLKSEGYPQQTARENGIQSVIKNRSNADFYSVKSYESNGRFYISLRAANYREIARSCSFDTEAEALSELPYVTGEKTRTIIAAAAPASTGTERADNKVDDDYLICREYAGQGAADENGIVKFSHTNGKHYFAWVDNNGGVIMRSEGYPTTGARDNGANSVIKNRDNEDRYVTFERMGRYFVTLKAGNHQEIARSCPYDSEASARVIYPSGRASQNQASATIITTSQGTTETTISDEKTTVVNVTQGTTETTISDEKTTVVNVTQGTTDTTIAEAGSTVVSVTQGETIRTTSESNLIETTFTQSTAPITTTTTRIVADVPPPPAPIVTTTRIVIQEPAEVEDDYLPCREYEGHTVTDKVHNIALFAHNGQLYFAVYNADGSVRLRSEGFPSEQRRQSELAGVIKHLENDKMYATIARGDYSIKVLRDETGREVGRSCLHKEVAPEPIIAAPAPVVEQDVEDDYLPCREYEGHKINDKVNNVALFKHENGQYYFAIYGTNGKVRLRSEGFKTAQDRDKELSGALKNLSNKDMYTVVRRGIYWITVLKDSTGREVGRSCLEKDEPVIAPVEVVAPIAVAAVAAAVVAPRVEVDVEDDYLPCKDYEGHKINDKVNNVALFKHENGQYYFAIYNADGKVRLRSEGFRTTQDRDKELSGALKNLNNKDMYSTIRKGNYWLAVLKDSTGREVGRSCLEKDEPVVVPPVAIAAVAAAAAIVEIPKAKEEVKKVVVETPKVAPKVEIPKAAYTAPVVENVVEEVAASGFNWKWLLLLPLLLGAWFLFNKGCNKEPEVVTPAVTAVPVDTVKAVAPVVAAPVGCPACASSTDPIFTSVCDNPKKLSRLGTNPEFGNSHALSPTQFYEKIKKAYGDNDVDKEFLDRIYKQMGYTGFADAKAEQFSAVVIPTGTSGKLGYSKLHKTGCYTLPDDEYHRKAFHIKAANGCDLHFMKTCGNHFFFCAK